LSRLQETQALDLIAYSRARDMATNGYFAHYRPGSSTPAVLELLRGYGVAFNGYGEKQHLGVRAAGRQPGHLFQHLVDELARAQGEHPQLALRAHRCRHVLSGARVYMVEDFTN